MALIRVEMIPKFHFGDDVVLVATDHEGMGALQHTLSAAANGEQGLAPLISGGTRHEFYVGGVEARFELQERQVTWHLPEAKASEILNKLSALSDAQHPSHYYVDIDSPASILILSVDEYPKSPIYASGP